MKKDKPRAILSWATPNPVGPYKLITPPSPDLGRKTQTPIMPVMGGPLVNLPTPVMPTKQTTPVAPPMADKLVNVPTQQGRVVDKAKQEQDNDSWLRDIVIKPGREKVKHVDKLLGVISQYPDLVTRSPFIQKERADLAQGKDIYPVYTYGLVDDIQQLKSVDEFPIDVREAARLLAGLGGTLNKPGKVSSTSYERTRRAEEVASAYAPLNEKERDTFASLLPGWTGTFKELVDVARSLSK